MELRSTQSSDRAAAYIFETIALLAILGIAVVGTVTVTGITPASIADTTQVEQGATVGEEVDVALSASVSDGSLKQTVLAWDDDSTSAIPAPKFADGSGTPAAGDFGQFISYPDTAFGKRLAHISDQHDIQLNVYVIPQYPESSGGSSSPRQRANRIPIIQRGTPDETARTIQTTIPIYNQDQLRSPDNSHSMTTPAVDTTQGEGTVASSSSYPIPQGYNTSNRVYNVVTVQVVVWDV